jgi:hypothetical protein
MVKKTTKQKGLKPLTEKDFKQMEDTKQRISGEVDSLIYELQTRCGLDARWAPETFCVAVRHDFLPEKTRSFMCLDTFEGFNSFKYFAEKEIQEQERLLLAWQERVDASKQHPKSK